MSEQRRGREAQTDVAPAKDRANNLAVGITIAIIAVMAVAIAIDASSVPGLAFFAIVSLSGLIAALIVWG